MSKRIEAAQKSVEGHNFSIRKHLLEYDDVMNKQREAVYGLRRDLLIGFEGDTPEEQNGNQRDYILGIAQSIFDGLIDQYMPKEQRSDEWDLVGLKEQLRLNFGFDVDGEGLDLVEMAPEEAREAIWPKIEENYQHRKRCS